jgi:hypothetical protein
MKVVSKHLAGCLAAAAVWLSQEPGARATDLCTDKGTAGRNDISVTAARLQLCSIGPGDTAFVSIRTHLVRRLDGMRTAHVDPSEVWTESSTTTDKAVYTFGELTDDIHGLRIDPPGTDLVAYMRSIAQQSGPVFVQLTFDQFSPNDLALWLRYAAEQSDLGNADAVKHMADTLDSNDVFENALADLEPVDLVDHLAQAAEQAETVSGVEVFFKQLVFHQALPTLQTLGTTAMPASISATDLSVRFAVLLDYLDRIRVDAIDMATLVQPYIEAILTFGSNDATALADFGWVAASVPQLDQQHLDLVENALGAITVPGFDRTGVRALLTAMEARIGVTSKLAHAEQILAGAAGN